MLDAGLIEAVRQDGHDVFFVVEQMPGATDTEVLHRAFEDERILLTEDKDFGELVFRLRRPIHGLILMRFASHEEADKARRLRRLLDEEGERLQGAFVVLEPRKARIRPLP